MAIPKLPCISVFFLLASLSADQPWQNALQKNGITIETRKVPGSAFKEIRAEMKVDTTLQRVMAVMRDIPGYTAWMKDCKEAKQIAKFSEESGVVFSVQATPWPIAEREAVVKFVFRKSANPAAFTISLEAMPSALPANDRRVRISQLRGYWRFVEAAPRKVEVTYSLYSDPGGHLPGWAVSAMAAHLPYETLNNLRTLLQK